MYGIPSTYYQHRKKTLGTLSTSTSTSSNMNNNTNPELPTWLYGTLFTKARQASAQDRLNDALASLYYLLQNDAIIVSINVRVNLLYGFKIHD